MCQFLFGLSQSLASPEKRKCLFGSRKLPLGYHALFAFMFFIGPYLGNFSTAITNADFYPVFLVVRSCGSVSSMVILLFDNAAFGALSTRRTAAKNRSRGAHA
jgi:hypothetical protein